jgi:hypothetical protein
LDIRGDKLMGKLYVNTTLTSGIGLKIGVNVAGKGDKGEKGDKGDKGEKGDTGGKGDTGDITAELIQLKVDVQVSRNSAVNAEASALIAKDIAEEAALNAKDSEVAAKASADNVKLSEINSGQSAFSAGASAILAMDNILNGVSTHNDDETAHAFLLEEIRQARTIAEGRATGYVFDTLVAMNNWLAVPANVALLVMGDNLYIRATGVKDYWWDGTQAQVLETDNPDLTNYYTKTQVDAMVPINITRAAYDALVLAGTVQAGRIYDIVEA